MPRKTPKRLSDTRRSRRLEMEVPLGLEISESFAKATMPDGTVEVLENDITYTPAAGYVSIQDFMA